MTGEQNNGTVFTVTNPNEPPFKLILKGRNAWALHQLLDAGNEGCTPIKRPAPRWSAYIHNLRKFGVSIRTITEKHGGDFAGNHGRYVLIAEVAIIIGGAM